jgi:hypothetical protein
MLSGVLPYFNKYVFFQSEIEFSLYSTEPGCNVEYLNSCMREIPSTVEPNH